MSRVTCLFIGLIVLLFAGCSSQSVPAPSFIETGIDPDSWVTVPAGEFYYGQHEHETDVSYNYEIMVTNVTNKQYARFLNESLGDGTFKLDGAIPVMHYAGDEFHGYEHEEEIPEAWYPMIALDDSEVRIVLKGQEYVSIPEYANHPVTYVTWFGAVAYSNYFGWRLPTEIEWEKAARGTDTRPFPWGDTLDSRNANYYSSNDIFEKTFGKQGGTNPVGFYNGAAYEEFSTIDSPSPYGLYDMAGNVWQWTANVYKDQHYRYMRGGSKDTYGHNLRVWTRNSAGPVFYGAAVGFRCVR